jgi:hypothetical protein
MRFPVAVDPTKILPSAVDDGSEHHMSLVWGALCFKATQCEQDMDEAV